jgi:molybdopterin/thiamine biosynthesis adenylyltransferase
MEDRDRDRYSRQIRFPGIGLSGQQRLIDARVAIVGCGALGSFHATALLRAGVRRLLLVDRDYVELNNLQRQWLYNEEDAVRARPKVEAAAHHLRRIDSECQPEPVAADLTAGNIEEILDGVQLILDGTDNFETRYLINDFAVRRGIPWIYGAAVGSYGITMPIVPGSTCCFSCLYPQPPAGIQPTCETAGVINALTSAIASFQVSVALQLLCKRHHESCITTIDVWNGKLRRTPQPAARPDCEVCGLKRFSHLEGRRRAPISLCGRNAVQIHDRGRSVDLVLLKEHLLPLGEVRANELALRFFVPPYEMTIFQDGRAIVKGTTDVGIARRLYAQYLGS